jgi:hypothetical protein
MINEALDMTKPELKKMIKNIFDDEFKKGMDIHKKEMMDDEGVRKIVRGMLKKQYRTFWEKSSLFIDKL